MPIGTAAQSDRVLPSVAVEIPIRVPAEAAADARSFVASGVQRRGRWLAWLEKTTDNTSTRAIRYTATVRRTRIGSGVVDAFVLAERSTAAVRMRLSGDGTMLAEAAGALWILPTRGRRVRIELPPRTRVCRFDRSDLLLQPTGGQRPGLILHRIGVRGDLSPARPVASPPGDWRRPWNRLPCDPHAHCWVSTDGRAAIHKGTGRAFRLADRRLTVDMIHEDRLYGHRDGPFGAEAWLIRLPGGREKRRLPAPDRILFFCPAGVVTGGPAGACLRHPVSGRRAHIRLGRGECLGFEPVTGHLVVTSRRAGADGLPALRTLDPAATPVTVEGARVRSEARRLLDAIRRVHLRARERGASGGTLGRLYDVSWPFPPPMQRTLLEILQADPDVNARRRAAVLVGFQDQPGAASALLGALADRKRSYFVRQGILDGLAFVARRADSRAIREAAIDRGTLSPAARTLAILGDPSSIAFLEGHLEDPARGRPADERRAALRDALQCLTDRPRIDEILGRLARPGAAGKDD